LEVVLVRTVKTAGLQAALLEISGLNRKDINRSCRVSPAVLSRRLEPSCSTPDASVVWRIANG
jgi:hypothetical protein